MDFWGEGLQDESYENVSSRSGNVEYPLNTDFLNQNLKIKSLRKYIFTMLSSQCCV